MRRIYLDHAATTPLDPSVLEAMLPYLKERFGNASSLHSFGQEAKKVLGESREKIAEIINADKEEVYFTSGGTESDNLAIKGVALRNKERNHIITSKIEHHAVLNPCKHLEKKGFQVTYLPVDEYGLVNANELEQEITDKTCLISIMHANNEIGTIQPIEEVGKVSRERDIYVHTDAIQTVGKIPVNVDKLNVDLLSISGHKLYGPKGIGVLYIRKGTKIEPIVHGGGHERGIRSGTENIPGIVGLAKAMELSQERMGTESRRLTNLRDKLIKGIFEIENSRLNGHPTKRLANNANFSFTGIEGESLLLRLDAKGIAVSTGSACSSHSLKPSHVLLAIGLKPEDAHGSLRITLGRGNTEEDIDYTIETVKEEVQTLRGISPKF